mmetsp:Transcript_27529/g.89668  ORF Transcript_27529/g.89668 Transcript_27529/m.89668 type:complete len:138 (-) Transcript_27529:83-496(-)
MPQCFIGFGVCKGNHEYKEGRSAMAAEDAWMLSSHSGKAYSNGGMSKQFLPGIGTKPYCPGEEHLAKDSVRVNVGDRLGLLADMQKHSLYVYVNGVCQGEMFSGIPDGVRFVVDLGDEEQEVEILPTDMPGEELSEG